MSFSIHSLCNAAIIGGIFGLLVCQSRAEDTFLADAVEARDFDAVESLLADGAPLDARQPGGMTALLWAAYHDDAELAKRLIDRGANASLQNRYGVAPLYLACLNGNEWLTQSLLKAGADPNTTIGAGETVLMTAARTGDAGCVAALVEAGAEIGAVERKGQNAIMWAAAEGNLDAARTLIDAGADFRTPLESGYTPFFFAVREGETEMVRFLLESGADVNEAMRVRGTGNKLPRDGTSALILAVENGHYDLAIELVERGADPNDQRSGFTALHTLAWVRKPAIGESEKGDPAPLGSGRRNSDQFIHDLVELGADVNARVENGRPATLREVAHTGITPLWLAAERADLPYIKMLVAFGADPTIANEHGCTPLMMAAGVGSRAPEEEAGSEEECLETIEYLVSLGAEVNKVDANGETAMHGAAYRNMPSVAWYLHDQGADIQIWNTENSYGWTPLLIAEGYRPGNFKPSFVTVDAITGIMLASGIEPPSDPRPKAINEYRTPADYLKKKASEKGPSL